MYFKTNCLWIVALMMLSATVMSAGIAFQGQNHSQVFYTDASKTITLARHQGRTKWTIYDFWNRNVANGIMGQGENRISIPIQEPGYYQLKIQDEKGTAETGFAVLTPNPPTLKSSPFSVSTHFAQGWEPWLIPLIKGAGFSWIRDECYWANVERSKGSFDFNFTNAKRLKIASEQLNVMLVFGYGNKLYDNNSAPTSPTGLTGWKNYMAATIGAFPQIDVFETWNEYNCGFNMYGKTDPTPQNYLLLLKATYEQLKQNRPNAKLLGISTATLPWGWIESVFKLGGLKYMDAVSVHPYRWGEWNKNPETLFADMMRLRQLIDQYAEGRMIPIYVTEVGWPVNWKYKVSSSRQAMFVARTYANLIRAGVTQATWYSFMKPPHDQEQFAIGDLIDNHYIPRPSFPAIAAMTRELGAAEYSGEETVPSPALCLKFKKADKSVRMLWNPDSTPLALNVKTSEPIQLTDIMGMKYTLSPHSGMVYLVLAQLPVYLEGKIESIKRADTLGFKTSGMLVAFNTPFNLTFNAGADFTLEVDGRTITGGDSVRFDDNNVLGTRNIKGMIKAGNSVCGFFCFSYDVLERLSVSRIQLLNSGLVKVEFNNITPENKVKLTEVSGSFDKRILSIQHTDAIEQDLTFALNDHLENYDLKELILNFKFPDHPPIKYQEKIGNNPCYFREDIKIDADLSEWQSQPCIDLRNQGKYVGLPGCNDPGAEKFNGKIWLGWSKTHFYLAAEIVDETHKLVFPVWKGDSIQLGFGKAFPADMNTSLEVELAFDPEVKKIGWLFPGRHPLGFNGGDIRKYSNPKMARIGNKSLYEVAIPWDKIRFIKAGEEEFRFSILVNNNDGTKRLGWLEWGSGIGSRKNPELFPIINFIR